MTTIQCTHCGTFYNPVEDPFCPRCGEEGSTDDEDYNPGEFDEREPDRPTGED